MNKLALGTVQFGLDYGISNNEGITPIDEVANILVIAKNVGIEIIDTAYAYGISQKILGQVKINDFKVVSKFIPPNDSLTLNKQIQKTLIQLSVQNLYGMLAHRPLSVVEDPKLWDVLQQFKEKGKIQKIGFSFNTLEEVDIILSHGFMPDLVQVPFNYFDHRFVNYMKELKVKGCEIHTRSAFLQGLFFIKPDKLPSFFNSVKSILELIQHRCQPIEGSLLSFCINQDFIDKVVFGVNNQEQLIKNIDSIKEAKILPELNISVSNEIKTPSMWSK